MTFSLMPQFHIRIWIFKRYVTIQKYRHSTYVDKAKGRWLPWVRGTLIPSVDPQGVPVSGYAVNWLGVRFCWHTMDEWGPIKLSKRIGFSKYGY
jgi:hypothetical protein